MGFTPERIIGIDPGNHGAFAALNADGSLYKIYDMPLVSGRISMAAIEGILLRWAPWAERVVLENVVGAPNNGGSRAFVFGRGIGFVQMACHMLRLPVVLVTPQVWKRAMRVTKNKETSLIRARGLFPDSADYFTRKKDDGRAEAALIARWGWEQARSQNAP